MNNSEIKQKESEQPSIESELPTIRDWRREKVWELKAKGYSYREILQTLRAGHPEVRISLGTITADIKAKQDQIDRAYRDYVDAELPYQHSLALTNLQAINKQAWAIFESSKDEKIKLQALHTAKEAQAAINDLMTAPESIQKAIKVVGKLKGHLQKGESQ